MNRAVSALALATLLVLAGCSAPVPGPDDVGSSADTTQTPQTTTTESATTGTAETTATTETTTENESAEYEYGGPVNVTNGSLPFNASLVFERVTALLEVNVTPPEQVDIKGHDAMQTDARGLPEFAEVMGIGDGDANKTVAAAGVTRGPNYVALNARILDNTDRARDVLVHEYVHVVQYRQGSIETTYRNINPGTTDAQMTHLAVVEGIPVYVEGEYDQEYGHGEPTGMDQMVEAYHGAEGVRRYALAPYAFGAVYAEQRAGNASAVDAIYENPPNTTEAIIHGYMPGEEPVRRLQGDISTHDWNWADRDRLGELFVRQVLVSELDRDRVATAAEGWGVDRHYTFENGNQTAYVWALRWDSVQDADEFETATRDYLDARGQRVDGRWQAENTSYRVVRTSPETVVLVVGPDDFVTRTEIGGTNETVTVAS